MISKQFASRLPSIPEGKPFVIVEDTRVSSWCHTKLRNALRSLMRSKYAAPFATSKSGASMSLQAIEKSLVGGRYVNNEEEFWLDVDKCWDASAHTCGVGGTFANIGRPAMADMANRMRRRAEHMESVFWRKLFELQQNPSDVFFNCSDDDADGNAEKDAQVDAWGLDSWIVHALADVGDWMLSTVVNEM